MNHEPCPIASGTEIDKLSGSPPPLEGTRVCNRPGVWEIFRTSHKSETSVTCDLHKVGWELSRRSVDWTVGEWIGPYIIEELELL